jgi:hypothetical protein
MQNIETFEEEVFKKTLRFLSPVGSLDYKGFDFPFSVVKNPNRLHNMFETGDTTYHTGVLLRALAWRWKAKANHETEKAIFDILNYFTMSQKYNNGCLVRSWTRHEGYSHFPESEKNGTLEANWFGESAPEGSYRYRGVTYMNASYWLRYDISVDAIVTAFTGLYWVAKFGNDAMKSVVKDIAKSQLDYYRKNDWAIRDDQGRLLRYGRHWQINPLCNINRKIITYLAEGGLVERSCYDFFLTRFSTNIPFRHPSTRVQFNNYMSISALAVIQDMGIDVSRSIRTLAEETIAEWNWMNNKIAKYFLGLSLPVLYDVPLTTSHSLHYKLLKTPVPHGNRHNTLNVWEVSAYRMSVAQQEGVFDLPQAWWLELYWCYEK